MAASREVMKTFTGDPADILGVGLCMIAARPSSKRDGSLLEPVMSWMDTRAYQPWVPDDPELAGHPLPPLGYMTHRFTGRFRDSAAANNIILQWPIDTDTWQWDPALFERFNVTRDLLVELQMPGDVAGYVTAEAAAATGIPEGLPVVTTANDKAVEALGSGSLQRVHGADSPGHVHRLHGARAGEPPGRRGLLDQLRPASRTGTSRESGGVRRGMWTLSWFPTCWGRSWRQRRPAGGRQEYLEREAELVPAGSCCTTVLDWLAPTDKPFLVQARDHRLRAPATPGRTSTARSSRRSP